MGERERQVRARVVMGGRVQGVWFRASTQERARELALTGWVRNRHDGKVEAVFEGPSSAVRRMVAWCYRGPRMAQVRDVELEWEEPTGEFEGFSVRY
jgi:acylphosphatase